MFKRDICINMYSKKSLCVKANEVAEQSSRFHVAHITIRVK